MIPELASLLQSPLIPNPYLIPNHNLCLTLASYDTDDDMDGEQEIKQIVLATFGSFWSEPPQDQELPTPSQNFVNSEIQDNQRVLVGSTSRFLSTSSPFRPEYECIVYVRGDTSK